MAKSGDWTSQLYLHFEEDDSQVIYTLNDSEIKHEFPEITGVEERIRNIRAFKCPLVEGQLMTFIMYHMFIVFETDNWWWSIEKRGEGILIQRSKYLSSVRDRRLEGYAVIERDGPIKLVESDMSSKTTWELVNWLYTNDELNKPWALLTSNCKSFAKRAFDYLGRYKDLYWFDGFFA